MSASTEPPCKKAKVVKSMYITDGRSEDLGTFKYVYEFTQDMVPGRVWKALMSLEEKGKFHFPNVGDCGYHALVDSVHHRQNQDDDFHEFFNLAMEEIHAWPRKGSTRETSTKQLANCSWMVDILEE